MPCVVRIPLCLLVLSSVSAIASATNYYVNPTTGSNLPPNTGGFYDPFLTINKACSSAHPGDTIYLRGATYYLNASQGIGPLNSGSSTGGDVTIRPYMSETVILDGTGTGSMTDTFVINGSYITLQDITIQNSQKNAISLFDCNHVNIIRCTFRDSYYAGVYTWCSNNVPKYSTSDIKIDNCYFYHNSQVNASHAGPYWAGAVHPSISSNVTVSNCTVYENNGEGIDLNHVKGAKVCGNTCYDNFSVNLYLDNATDTVVKNNRIYSTGNTNYYFSSMPAVGICLANEGLAADANYCANDTIINNLVLGGRYCFRYGGYGAGGGIRNSTIANNTFYNGYQNNLDIPSDAGHTGNVYQNNISYGTNTAHTHANGTPSAGWSFDHNCWYGYGSGGTTAPASPLTGTGDVVADPLLVAPSTSNYTDTNYALTSSSPCIDVAATVTSVLLDYFGTSRPQGSAYDIGFHEYVTPSPFLFWLG